MSGRLKRAALFGWGFSFPLPGGDIDSLCKEDSEASCQYTEFTELCKLPNLTIEQQERKKQIIAILQEKIAIMKTKKEEEKRKQEEIADAELAGIQLSLFPAWVCFFQKQKAYCKVRFLIYQIINSFSSIFQITNIFIKFIWKIHILEWSSFLLLFIYFIHISK